MPLSLTEDIRSITDLKRHTREIIDQIHQTGRPVILTVNGRADAVIRMQTHRHIARTV